jgi:ferredoxin
MEIDQRQAPGAGEPLFSAVHVTRQRRGMVDLLCHVCGRPTAAPDRYIFPTASGGMVTLHDGAQQYGCNVPPMHLACARRALAACPHLSKVHEPPLRCTRDEGRLIHRTDVVAGMEALAKSLPKDVEVVFSCYRLYGPDFTRRVLAAREAWEKASRARRVDLGR